MSKDKYYTPKIEEFHVGFEFESNYVLLSRYGWAECKLDENNTWFTEEWYVDASPTEFRVKYLDQEDIESLGFEYTGGLKGELNFNALKDEAISITYKANSKELSISNEDNDDIYYTLFQGTIKNKSELERVLEMIGYKD